MTQNNHCSLSLNINQHNQIKCSIIDSQNKEHIIKLNDDQHEYIPITISFDMNEIIIGQENKENTIHFMNDLIHSPDDFKEYHIKFQNKEYSVIAEVLFTLFINKFKTKIEKDWIIDFVFVYIPSLNGNLYQRLKIHWNQLD